MDISSKPKYSKSYGDYPDSKGLFLISDPHNIALRQKIIKTWEEFIVFDSNEVITPVLVPRKVLEDSGHLKEFKDEIFFIKDHDLCLRPETAQAIFANFKFLRRAFKGNPLKIHQVGRAFRNQKSSREGRFRRNEFEQLELEILGLKDYDFVKEYIKRLEAFFKALNLEVQFRKLNASDRPHYSQETYDLYCAQIEIGCINVRGTHDLYTYTPSEKKDLCVYEVSLGLDRILELLNL